MAKKPTITSITSGYASTNTLNDNFEALRDAFDNTLSLDGSTPNSMTSDLNLNNNDILNASRILVGGVDYIATALSYKNDAETAKTAAEAAQAAAELAYDNFDDRYLGAKSSDPTVDNDGNALIDGALYYDIANTVMKFYDTSTSTWYRTTPNTSDQANIDIVAGNTTNINTVAGISANVTTVAGISSDVTTVAADGIDIGTVATSISNVNTAATNISNINTVAGISANVTTVAGNTTNINTVAGNNSNITTVAGISSDVTTVAGQTTNLQNVTDNLTAIQNASTNATNAANSASAAATSAAAAAASADFFDDVYLGSKASDPATDNDGDALNAGDLYFNTSSNNLKVYSGSAWQDAAVDSSGFVQTTGDTMTGNLDVGGTVTADGLTVSPSGTQQVLANLRANSGSGGGLVVQTDASDDGLIRGYDASGNIQLQFDTDGGDSYIAKGNLGIGTSSPASELHLANTSTTITLEDTDNVSTNTIVSSFGQLSLRADTGSELANSRIDFKVDGSERMRIDSSGRVGIGTSSPAEELHVETTGGATAGIQLSTTGGTVDRDWKFLATAAAGTFYIQDATASVNRLAIDTSGNVGIGTTSPHDSGVNFKVLTLNGVKGGSLALTRGTNSATKQWAIRTSDDDALRFEYGSTLASEAMRIDSSGNLLVGTTDPSLYNNGAGGAVGVGLNPSGYLQAARSNSNPLLLNRLDSDGTIADFRKNGTVVGSIGTVGSDLTVGTGDVALRFQDGSDNLVPHNVSTNSTRDAAINIGTSGARWKDLYLSGGVYLGGTGSANKLDDYESGSWTPVIRGSSTAGSYTATIAGAKYIKVGKLVTVSASISNITEVTAGSGYLQIAGLPFNKPAATYASGSVGVSQASMGFTPSSLQVEFISTSGTSNTLYVYAHRDSATSVNFQLSHLNTGNTDIRFTITYESSA